MTIDYPKPGAYTGRYLSVPNPNGASGRGFVELLRFAPGAYETSDGRWRIRRDREGSKTYWRVDGVVDRYSDGAALVEYAGITASTLRECWYLLAATIRRTYEREAQQ